MNITFPNQFDKVPTVKAVINSAVDNGYSFIAYISVSVSSVSRTGCTLKFSSTFEKPGVVTYSWTASTA